jgi:hypothetical protein
VIPRSFLDHPLFRPEQQKNLKFWAKPLRHNGTADNARGRAMDEHEVRHPVVVVAMTFLLGLAYLLVSVPGVLAALSRQGLGWLAGPAAFGAWCDRALPGFGLLFDLALAALVAFAIAMTLLAVRHGGRRLAGRSLAALVAGLVVLHLLAWLGTGVYQVVRFVSFLLAEVAALVPHDWMPDWIFWALLAAVALWWVCSIVWSLRTDWQDTVHRLVTLLVIGAVRVGIVLLLTVGAPVVRFVEHWLAVVVVAVAILVGIAALGQLLVDQVRSSLLTGRGERGLALGALGVGTALATLLLESGGLDNYVLLPGPVADWARTWLLSAGPPTVDALLAVLVIGLCLVGLAGNVRTMRTPPDRREFRASVIYTAAGVVAAVGLAALSGAGQSHGSQHHS